ncbi:hypothetical protein CALVIDRAFT_594632 [Calocera viscosa TUFC12733]|uniref:Uncharacterized protein n=1 Tax=Calocera viscosa (strain TUFC12733) TaxID=1330018 RepID=A0A167RNG1_CALVF|nr:hypothetical protein CALVIDRAFT_594632 [Calocera viscosa TUFC12733]
MMRSLSPPSTLRRASDSIARRIVRVQHSPTDDHPAPILHRAWGIDDIIRLILEHCDLPTAVALGRTCGYLFCVCVEVVWERCRDLDNLQRQVLGGKETVAMVYRRLQSSPLAARSFRLDTPTRMALYCARIRALSVDQHAVDTDPLHLLSKFLGSRSLRSSFPALRRVSLTVFTNKALETGIDFVAELPDLQYFGVYHRAHFVDWPVGDTTGHPIQRRLPTLFRALQRLQRLDFLRLSVEDGRLDEGGEAYAFVDGLTTTRLQPDSLRFKFSNVKSPYLTLLQKFTTLRSLECSLDTKTEIPASLALPGLRHIMISSRSIQAFLDLLSRLEAPFLTAVELKPEHVSEMYDVSYTSDLFTDAYATISSKWPGLTRFAMYYRCPLASPLIPVWYFNAFRPLLACTQLKVFLVNAEPLIRISDADVRDIVTAWPDLEVLVLSTLMASASASYPSLLQKLSYESFLSLAACRSLRTLVLNAIVGERRPMPSLRPAKRTRIETVVLRESRGDPEEWAAGMLFLRGLFPALALTGQQGCPRCGLDQRLERKGQHVVLQSTPLCCVRDVAVRLGVPGIAECLSATRLQKTIRGDCILCHMDFVSDFETFAEWSNMYGS